MLAPVDERRVDAERDVVQEAPLARAADVDAPLLALEAVERRERVVAVEAEVAGEVVARAEGDDDEGQVALDRDRGHARDRAVAARGAEHVRVGRARQLDESSSSPSTCASIPRARAAAASSSGVGLSVPARGLISRRPGTRPTL